MSSTTCTEHVHVVHVVGTGPVQTTGRPVPTTGRPTRSRIATQHASSHITSLDAVINIDLLILFPHNVVIIKMPPVYL